MLSNGHGAIPSLGMLGGNFLVLSARGRYRLKCTVREALMYAPSR
jgi:hypothetical protein